MPKKQKKHDARADDRGFSEVARCLSPRSVCFRWPKCGFVVDNLLQLWIPLEELRQINRGLVAAADDAESHALVGGIGAEEQKVGATTADPPGRAEARMNWWRVDGTE